MRGPLRGRELTVQIETTNRCNYRCIMCPRTDRAPQPPCTMSPGKFKKLLLQLKKVPVKTFVGHNLGEPLLTPGYIDMLEMFDTLYSRKKFIMNTNASRLSETFISRFLQLHNNHFELNISLDAVRSPTYTMIHGHAYAPVKQHVLQLLHGYLEHPNRNITIVLNFTISPMNIGEQKMFIDHWKPFVKRSPNIRIRCNPLAWTASLKKRFNYDVWTHAHPDAGIIRLDRPRRKYCFKPWNMLSVRANGDVSICCYSAHSGLIIGNFNKRTIAQLLQGKKIRTLRRSFIYKDLSAHPRCYFCHG